MYKEKKQINLYQSVNILTTVIPIWMIFVFLLVTLGFPMFVTVRMDIFINKKRKSAILKKKVFEPFNDSYWMFFPQDCW